MNLATHDHNGLAQDVASTIPYVHATPQLSNQMSETAFHPYQTNPRESHSGRPETFMMTELCEVGTDYSLEECYHLNGEHAARFHCTETKPRLSARDVSKVSKQSALASPPGNLTTANLRMTDPRQTRSRGKILNPGYRSLIPFVTPRTHGGSLALSKHHTAIKGATVTVTPHDHDAGMTLATLRREPKPSEHADTHQITCREVAILQTKDSQQTFPEVVHAMVTETAASHPDLISWIVDGEGFVIDNKNRKLGSVLLKFFRHKKYSSLQRQLNMYGWKKHITGKYKGGFHHPLFHRDITCPAALASIRRRPPPSVRKPRHCERSRMQPPVRPSQQKAGCSKLNQPSGRHKSSAKPPRYRFKAKKASPHREINSPTRFKGANTKDFVPSKGDDHAMGGQVSGSPWQFDESPLSPDICWSPLIENCKLPDLIDEERNEGLNRVIIESEKPSATARIVYPPTPEIRLTDSNFATRLGLETSHEINTGEDDDGKALGSIRMTIFNGKLGTPSPVEANPRVVQPVARMGWKYSRDGTVPDNVNGAFSHASVMKLSPVMKQESDLGLRQMLPGGNRSTCQSLSLSTVATFSEPTPSPTPLVRNGSSSFFIPVPMPLLRGSSSSFFLPFLGMANALSYALGVTPDEPDARKSTSNTGPDLHCDEDLMSIESFEGEEQNDKGIKIT